MYIQLVYRLKDRTIQEMLLSVNFLLALIYCLIGLDQSKQLQRTCVMIIKRI